jgi:hypothetical protein
MYYKSLYYAFLMVLFGILAYLFLLSGFNTKTKVYVNYEDSSNVYYDVKYIDNQFANKYNDKYVSSLVDYIDINYVYNNLISEYVSGYYKYSVDGYLIAYEDNIADTLWERKYELVKEKTVVLDKNNINNIKIDGSFKFDFKRYRDEIYKFINDYDIDISGYMNIRVNISEFLNFNSLDNEYADNKVIHINIPLTNEIFRINTSNTLDKDSYYEFTSKKAMNIVFLVIGALCLSFMLTSLVMIIRQFKLIYNKQSKYNRELNRILSKYDDCIVKVKRFYVNRKYNMIYVSSFSELMDVYNNKNKMISFKEIKRNSESIFVIIDGDDAWIYKLISLELE